MGVGASQGLNEATVATSASDLKDVFARFDAESRSKLATALKLAEADASSGFKAVYGDDLAPSVKTQPEWIRLGCGDATYHCAEKEATFPGGGQACPALMPDLSGHNNIMAEELRNNPELWAQLKDLKTAGGCTFSHCIKTGMDNKGHPMIKTCGMVLADEECANIFGPLFDKVMNVRHSGYGPSAKHVSDMDVTKISGTKIDPTGKYISTTRCRTGRSIRGLALPPGCNFQSRRETEKVIVKGLARLEGELKGEYFPLCGSKSNPDGSKPEGMTPGKEEELRSNGNLFQEPDSTLLLSGGMGRNWPDARGIFHNKANNFFVWVNEEDHMRIISMEKGDNVKGIFTRFANATKAIQEVLVGDGKDFMHNAHLGFILTCPSNCGTGLRAGAMVTVPKFSTRADFKTVLGKMRLQARGTAGVDSVSDGKGTFDISNADRIGYSEVQLCNMFIEGLAQIIRWEQALEGGKDIETEVAAAKPLGL